MNTERQPAVTNGDTHPHPDRRATESTMTTTASHLFRWAGLSAVVAGSCFVAFALLHPSEDLSSLTTARWAIAHASGIAMSLFGLLGMTGLYARQAEAAGWLGLAGFLLVSLWLVLLLPYTFFEVVILPLVATAAPTFAEGFLGMVGGTAGDANFGVVEALWALLGVLLLLGGLLFGIATLRAGILPRRPAGLLAVGAGLAPIYGLLPHELEPLAAPIGVALAWLGYALWSERREPASEPLMGRGRPRLRRTGAD